MGTKDHWTNPLPSFGELLEISLVVINILIGFKSTIQIPSSSFLFVLYLSVEEEGHGGRSTTVDI